MLEKDWKERRGDRVAAKSRRESQESTSKCGEELAQEEVGVVEEVREKERTTKWADVRGNEEMEEAEGQRVGTEKTGWMGVAGSGQGKRRRSFEENREGEGQRKVAIGSENGKDRVWDGACCLICGVVAQTRGNARSTGRNAGHDRKGEGKRKREVRKT